MNAVLIEPVYVGLPLGGILKFEAPNKIQNKNPKFQRLAFWNLGFVIWCI